MSEKEILTLREAADLIGRGYTRMYEDAKAGKLPCAKIGGKYYFHKKALLDWIYTLSMENVREYQEQQKQAAQPMEDALARVRQIAKAR
jgi:excisionase family DNA binding protein